MKKYWRYLIEFCIALVIVYMFGRVYNLYEKSKLSDTPFDPEVWGTFSDWCLVLVTILTAIFLIKTFKEQKRTNEIAYSQHRRTIMPKFELDNGIIEETDEDFAHLILILSNNELQNLNVTYLSDDFQNISQNIPLNAFPSDSLTLVVGTISTFFIAPLLTVEISFEDSEGNKYIQRLFKRSFDSFSLTTPIYIKPT